MALGNPDTKFLVYSGSFRELTDPVGWTAEVEQRFPPLKDRVVIMPVPSGDRNSFRHPETAEEIRRLVIATLDLEGF